MASFETYNLTIAAGSSRRLDFMGDFVTCLESNLPDFRISIDGQPSGKFFQGLMLRRHFQFVEIENTGSASLTILLGLGSAEFEDRRLISSQPQSPYPVTLEDVSNRGFVGKRNSIPVAGQYAQVQIWNPPGSKKICLITGLILSAAGVGKVDVRLVNTMLADFRSYTLSVVAGAANKVFELRTGTVASAPVGDTVAAIDLQANQSLAMQMTNPLVIPEGYGLMFWSGMVDSYTINIQGIEVAA